MKTGVSCKILQIGPQIHKLTEQIRQWLETPESYRYSFLKELISLNKKLDPWQSPRVSVYFHFA